MRSLAFAQTLRHKYRILFVHSGKYTTFVSRSGYASFPCEVFDSAEALRQSGEFRFDWLNERSIRRVLDAQVKVIRELRPAFIVSDAFPSSSMAAELCGVECHVLINGYLSPGYVRTRALPRTHPAHRILGLFPRQVRNVIIRLSEYRALKRVHRPFRRLRLETGLSIKRAYFEELYGDRNYICDSEWLFPQHRLPAAFEVIGPLYPLPVNGSGTPAVLGNTERILITGGSSSPFAPGFLARVRAEGYEVIHCGADAEVEGVISLEFADLDKVIPSCDLVICHGGNGTINMALKHGVPVLCRCAHFEQEWNAQALLDRGVGDHLDEDGLGDQLRLWIARKRQGDFLKLPGLISAQHALEL